MIELIQVSQTGKFHPNSWKTGRIRKIKVYFRKLSKLRNNLGFLSLSVYYNSLEDTLIKF